MKARTLPFPDTTEVGLEANETFMSARLSAALGDVKAAIEIAGLMYDDNGPLEDSYHALASAFDDVQSKIQTRLNREQAAVADGARIAR